MTIFNRHDIKLLILLSLFLHSHIDRDILFNLAQESGKEDQQGGLFHRFSSFYGEYPRGVPLERRGRKQETRYLVW